MTTVSNRTDAPETHKVRRSQRGPALKHAGNAGQETSPRERAELALLLRHDGLSWAKISERLGYAHPSGAYTAAMHLALKLTPPTPEQREAARADALARLDQLWPVIEEHLASSDIEERNHAIRQAQWVIDHYSALLGVPVTETPPAQRLARYGLALRTVEGEPR